MNETFEKEVVVKEHANYGAFKGEDGHYYKPVKGMTLDVFPVGFKANLKGFKSASGKTHYVTEYTAIKTPQARTFKRTQTEPAGDNKGLTSKEVIKPKYEGRDFVKEAKGKTMCQFISAMLHGHKETDTLKVKDIVDTAELLMKMLDERGYF